VTIALNPRYDRRKPETWTWVDRTTLHGCHHGVVKSRVLGRCVGFNIHLPPDYSRRNEYRFPVVYYVHGAGETESSVESFLSVWRDMRPDAILISPNCGMHSFYRDSIQGPVDAESWFIREFIPHIDNTYRTICLREGRSLSGWSMGGEASLRFAFKHADIFCASAAFRAALSTRSAVGASDTVYSHVERDSRLRTRQVEIWMAIGMKDMLIGGNRSFSKHLTELQIQHEFHAVPTTGHSRIEMCALLARDAINTLTNSMFSAAAPRSAPTAHSDIEPSRDMSQSAQTSRVIGDASEC